MSVQTSNNPDISDSPKTASTSTENAPQGNSTLTPEQQEARRYWLALIQQCRTKADCVMAYGVLLAAYLQALERGGDGSPPQDGVH